MGSLLSWVSQGDVVDGQVAQVGADPADVAVAQAARAGRGEVEVLDPIHEVGRAAAQEASAAERALVEDEVDVHRAGDLERDGVRSTSSRRAIASPPMVTGALMTQLWSTTGWWGALGTLRPLRTVTL
jgi:hypothetical protein